MTQDTAQRASEILNYLSKAEQEIILWNKGVTIDHIVIRFGHETYKMDGQFNFEKIRTSRIEMIELCQKQWREELENL